MKGIHRLNAQDIRSWLAGPRDSDPSLKLADGGGLNLVRMQAGFPSASWQVRYRIGRREKTYSIGPSHLVTLTQARAEHALVRAALAASKDPMQLRRLARAVEASSSGTLFGDVAASWLKLKKAEWSQCHYDKSSQALEGPVLGALGKLPVRDITPAMVSAVVGGVQESAGRETAAKILRHVRAIFRLAAATGLRDDNPAEAVCEILGKAAKARHRPALLTPEGVRSVLTVLTAAPISPAVLMCHRLIAFTAVRISNAVAARWEEFDLKAGVWEIPRSKMKMQDREHPHSVSLAPTLVGYLTTWNRAWGGPSTGFLFPGHQGRTHLTREIVERALLENGFRDRHTCHGWRASFSTLAKEAGFAKEVVDLTLDHVHDSAVARAYDRGERLEKRIKLIRWWGEVLG